MSVYFSLTTLITIANCRYFRHLAAALLALIFLRGVGIVGHSKQVRIQNAEREREKKQVDSTLSGDTPSMVV